ncbi:MAG: TatD family hydrolase [Chitinophagaceae bacterium]
MRLIDTHTHIYLSEFDSDRDAMLIRAGDAGVSRLLMPAIDSSTHQQMFDLEAKAPGHCLSMMGVHPCSVRENFQEELGIAGEYLSKRKFIAVGEIGLDFYWDKTFTAQQYEALHVQLEWALHYDIPFSLHSRNATEECIKVVKEHQKGKLKGVFHCFSGDALQARQITDLGLCLGIGGVVTFKNGGLDKVLPDVPLSSLVLETDAPYLAPVPYRGKRNEPSFLRYVVEKLAEIYQITSAEVAAVTTRNAERVFGAAEQFT